MRTRLIPIISIVAGALALSPALAAHPQHEDAEENAESRSDGEHENCGHAAESDEGSHDGHADHDQGEHADGPDEHADGPHHDCDDNPES